MTKSPRTQVGRSSLEDHPEYVRAIGMISIENANLEHSLASLFAAMLFIPVGVGHAIYLTPKSATARIEIFENAAKAAFTSRGDDDNKQKLKENLSRVKSLAKRARTLTGKRHGVIHDAWGVGKDDGKVRRYPLDQPLVKNEVEITALQSLVDDFRRLIGEVRTLRNEFKKNPPILVDMRVR